MGKVPYPGMDGNLELYLKLKDGYRMEKPMFATQELYEIMLSCWRLKADSRPLFFSLETTLAQHLDSIVSEVRINFLLGTVKIEGY